MSTEEALDKILTETIQDWSLNNDPMVISQAQDLAHRIQSVLQSQGFCISKWKDISEAPKDGTECLLSNGDNNYYLGYFETAKEWPTSKEGFNNWTKGATTANGYDTGFEPCWPTHFMPLPTPPKPKGGE